MKVVRKGIVGTLLLIIVLAFSGLAHSQNEGNILINSDPQGALVTLRGDVVLSGVTPVRFERVLSGRYEIEVSRDGYETHHSVTYFSESQEAALNIKLSAKTRVKAFMRSVFIPGWGQSYYGEKTKSALIFLGTVAAASGYAVLKYKYDSRVDDFHSSRDAYESATLYSDLPALRAQMRDDQRKANRAEDRMNIAIIALASVYAFNLLDTFIFFPEYNSYTEYKAITAVPNIGRDRVGLTLAVRF